MSGLAKQTSAPSVDGLERVLIEGDLGGLSQTERIEYYARVCQSVGLNPLTQPFEYLRLNNKTVLYAKRGATDQLRQIHKVSVTISNRERMDDIYVVTARATTPDGRCDESIGAVPLKNLQGEALANALMKGETKAKRRVTLAICGLSMLDETEVSSIQSQPAASTAPAVNRLDQLAAEGEHERHFVAPSSSNSADSEGTSAPGATTEPTIDVVAADNLATQYNDGLKATCEIAGMSETGEVDELGLMVPPGSEPVFQSGPDEGKTYSKVPAGKLRALVKNKKFRESSSPQTQVWANYLVTRHEVGKLLGGAK